jgi:DNA-binding transcriptional MerR regulator
MADEQERLYLTSDMRSLSGISRTTMDYYLRSGLIKPTSQSESGYLLFGSGERDRLLQIVTLRRQGYRLKEIRQLLSQEDAPS